MKSYLNSFTKNKILLIALSVALLLTIGRLLKSHFDPTYNIVAGTDFVTRGQTPAPVVVQDGQGYDGQFFYRYALAPLDFNNDVYGVHVDHPPYRIQRIGYPLLAWVFSLGGNPELVPWILILLNVVAFAGIFWFTTRFIELLGGNIRMALLPLSLCGLYMSLSRDLSEVTELFFYLGAVYYLFRNRYLLASIFIIGTILCRETSLIAWLPLAGFTLLKAVRKQGSWQRLISILIPIVIFIAWRFVIYLKMPSVADAAAGYGAIGIPFKGIVQGFIENFNFSDSKHILQFVFWIAYLFWQCWLVAIVFKNISFKRLLASDQLNGLKVAYLSWFLFAICFALPIYTDDWGFVRIFSLWNMTGFLLLIATRSQTGRLFNTASIILVALTVIRLIVRV